MRDFIIQSNEYRKKMKIQKRNLTKTLCEAFSQFREKSPDAVIGMSKFANLRPYACLRKDTPANHCLCIYHENVRCYNQLRKYSPNQQHSLLY